jgi:hypothetical protein
VSGCECDGSGKIVRVTDHSDDPWRDIGGGYQIGGGKSWRSELCACRKSLPPRDGEARWWTSETETIAQLQFAMFDEQAVVSLRPEVPVSEDNYVLKRTGRNRYYPTSVQLDVTDTELHWLFPDEARKLGEALIAAADRAEAIDGEAACPDCGSWDAPGNHRDGCERDAGKRGVRA